NSNLLGADRKAVRRLQTRQRQAARDLRSLMSHNPRMRLVDHSRGALLFQETILRRRQQETVLTALSGAEGLQKARAERPQLIVFAFDLFDMTAPEFCREIRNDPEIKS